MDLSPGVVWKKVQRRNFLRWASIYVSQSHWHTAASRIWKVHLRSSRQQRLLRTIWSRNLMRWDGRSTFCDLSDLHTDSAIGWNFTERRSNQKRLRYGHRERSPNLGSNCIISDSSSVPERGYWSCTEDYSTMWGSLSSAPWRLQDDWSSYSLGSIGCWTKGQRAAS